MPISTLIHQEEDALMQDTRDYVESLRPILPITLELRTTQALVSVDGKPTLLVGTDVRDTCRQVRELVGSLINPLLN